MPSSFEKAQAFDAQYERLSDPAMKARAKAYAERYYGLDLKESEVTIEKKRQQPVFNASEHLKVATPLLILVSLFAFLFGVGCLAVAVYAEHLKLAGDTEMQFMKFHLSTNNVGIGFGGLGVVVIIATIYYVVKRTRS